MLATTNGGNVVPFRRPAPSATGLSHDTFRARSSQASRAEQRSLMDTVYATGALSVAAGDRELKLLASRLQVYGFLEIEEIGEGGLIRRLRPSEAIRAKPDHPWRVSKPSLTTRSAASIPAVDSFLFDANAQEDVLSLGA